MKHLALIGLGLGSTTAVVALGLDRVTPHILALQCLGWTLAAASLVLLLSPQPRCDSVPDYLGLCKDNFFERDGFCFSVSLDRDGALAVFTIMFQSRYLGPSTARIALRPIGSCLATVSPEIRCGPAGFGIARLPVAIPRRHQGKTVTFEIGVDADYPQGKGREVRFRSGRTVCHDSVFCSVSGVKHSLAATCLTLPLDVAEYLPDTARSESQLLWASAEVGEAPAGTLVVKK